MEDPHKANGLRARRTSIIDEAMLEYDTAERTMLVRGLEDAVDAFLDDARRCKAFRGWRRMRTDVDSTHVFMYLGSSAGVLQEITSAHFAEVARCLSRFELRLPVHNGMDARTHSARMAQQCVLEYPIAAGERRWRRARTLRAVAVGLLILLLILLLGVFALFLKHTEHDSSRLGILWTVLYPGF